MASKASSVATVAAVLVIGSALALTGLSAVGLEDRQLSDVDARLSHRLFETRAERSEDRQDDRWFELFDRNEVDADLGRPLRQVGKLHDVPVFSGGGIVSGEFSDGGWWQNESRVKVLADRLAGEIGISKTMPALWELLADRDGTSMYPDGVRDESPYDYPGLRDLLKPVLTETMTTRHASELRDLAGLFMLLAPTPSDAPYSDYRWSAGAAYVILNSLRAGTRDCATELNFAVLVGFGSLPKSRVVDKVFKQAIDACPGDPTPRWYWGLTQNSLAVRDPFVVPTDLSRTELMTRPIATFRGWQRAEPGSALAFAGEGEVLVSQAETMIREGTMPFTTRSYARRALELFRTANRLEPDPAFAIGRARSLAALGKPHESVTIMSSLVSQTPRDDDYRAFYAQVLEQAHNFSTAAMVLDKPLTIRRSLALTPDVPAGRHPGWGESGAVPTTFYDPTNEDVGGADPDWLGFIPDYRSDEIVGAYTRSPWCRNVTLARLHLLSGQYTKAARVRGEESPDCYTTRLADSDLLETVAATIRSMSLDMLGQGSARDRERPPEITFDVLLDTEQNLWRYGGRLDRAGDVIDRWTKEGEASPLARQRKGEVAYLSKSFRQAVDAFRAAADAPVVESGVEGWDRADRALAHLQLGAALEQLGDFQGADRAFQEAIDAEPVDDFVRSAARTRRAGLAARRGDKDRAVSLLSEAYEAVRNRDCGMAEGDPLYHECNVTNGAEASKYAVALLDRGKPGDAKRALSAAKDAVFHDPLSQIYLETLAQAQQALGKEQQAIGTIRKALQEDPTLFQSWNNLGVVQARHGDWKEALHSFRLAVSVSPRYALGWFNLGVALEKSGDLIASQRALSKAVRLDDSLRGTPLALHTDTSTYAANVDVSRPIPTSYSVGQLADSPERSWSWVVLVLMLIRLSIAFGVDKIVEYVGTRVLNPKWHRKRQWNRVWKRLNAYPSLTLGVALAVAVAGWTLLGSTSGHWMTFTASLAVVTAMLWLYVAAPSIRRGAKPVMHRGWLPGILLGGTGIIAGYTFVPMPVNDDPATSRFVRWVGPVVLAGLGGLFLAGAVITGSPFGRTAGMAALTMLSVALFPIKPFDGGFARSRRIEAASSLALVGASGAMVLNWI